MVRKTWVIFCLFTTLPSVNPIVSLADTTTDMSVTTMENCGAYLFERQPVDCGNGHYSAILVSGNSITERDMISNRGYDYVYTFNPNVYSRQWGEVPTLVNVDGIWAIPENQPLLPEGI